MAALSCLAEGPKTGGRLISRGGHKLALSCREVKGSCIFDTFLTSSPLS